MMLSNEKRPMKNERVKKAVLKANLQHADVALRALDRIDRDDEFRAAIEAVLDLDDSTAVYNIIYAHIDPMPDNRFRHGQKRDLVTSKHKLTIDAGEVVKLLNDHALEVCIDLLAGNHIEECITQAIKRHFEAMVLEIVGMKSGNFNEIRIDEGKPIAKKIAALIREKALPIFETHLATVDLREIADKVVYEHKEEYGTLSPSTRTKEIFERAVRDLFKAASAQRAKRLAEVHTMRLVEEHFGPADKDEEQ